MNYLTAFSRKVFLGFCYLMNEDIKQDIKKSKLLIPSSVRILS